MIDPYLALPYLSNIFDECGLAHSEPDAAPLCGLQVGDVITWGSWGHAFLARTDANGKQHWGYKGVTLLVIDVDPDGRWLEVTGVFATAPHVRTGGWRWPVGLIDERLEHKGVRRIGRLVDML